MNRKHYIYVVLVMDKYQFSLLNYTVNAPSPRGVGSGEGGGPDIIVSLEKQESIPLQKKLFSIPTFYLSQTKKSVPLWGGTPPYL